MFNYSRDIPSIRKYILTKQFVYNRTCSPEKTLPNKNFFGGELDFKKLKINETTDPNLPITQCSGYKINNFGSGSRSFCELVMVKFFFQNLLITRHIHVWVEIFNFLNYSRIVNEI